MDYDGPERRSSWVTKTEFKELVEEVQNLSAAWKHHSDLYGEFLKTAVQERKDKSELRKIVLQKITEGGVWATVIFLAVSSWEYVRNHIK